MNIINWILGGWFHVKSIERAVRELVEKSEGKISLLNKGYFYITVDSTGEVWVHKYEPFRCGYKVWWEPRYMGRSLVKYMGTLPEKYKYKKYWKDCLFVI